MKESRFIELLNLYVDHQLSSAEASELEAEIARSPERRTMYRQYCQMQKACTVLFETERSMAPESKTLSSALRDADRKIVEFPGERSSNRWMYVSVSVAAMAACAAVVLVRLNHAPASNINRASAVAAVSTPAAPDVAQTVALPANLTAPAPVEKKSRQSLYTVFSSPRQNAVSNNVGNQFASDGTTSTVSYNWMREVEMAPLPAIANAKLTLQPASNGASEERVIKSLKPMRDTEERTAIQFQR